jgi:hypothetical protein
MTSSHTNIKKSGVAEYRTVIFYMEGNTRETVGEDVSRPSSITAVDTNEQDSEPSLQEPVAITTTSTNDTRRKSSRLSAKQESNVGKVTGGHAISKTISNGCRKKRKNVVVSNDSCSLMFMIVVVHYTLHFGQLDRYICGQLDPFVFIIKVNITRQ